MKDTIHRARGRIGLVAALLLAFVTACGWAASAASPPVPPRAPAKVVAVPSGIPTPATTDIRLADVDEQRLMPFIEIDAQARAVLERAQLQAENAAERLRAETLELKVNNGKGPGTNIAYRSPDQTEAHLYWVDAVATVAAPDPVPRK